MDVLIGMIHVLVTICGIIALLLSILHFIAFRWPAPAMWVLKVTVSSFTTVLLATGALTVIVGWTTDSSAIAFLGFAVLVINFIHFTNATSAPGVKTGFVQAFGNGWEKTIPETRRAKFLKNRTTLFLPATPQANLKQDLPFATVPGTGRALLCDLWLPPTGVASSGLAFIYLHGSAFYLSDKDYGTRPFFSHLAAQGHVIMDVAYRLSPETDIKGMVHDAKRAVAWLKDHAAVYGIDPGKIILGGGSAGGHLALLAAYTPGHTDFTPDDLAGKDTSVCGAISVYGTTDLEALYYHTNQHLTTRSEPGRPKKPVPTKMPDWLIRSIGSDFHRLGFDKGFEKAGALAYLLGGHPDEIPQVYKMYSPATYVHGGCPPTLLIQGAHDIMAPLKAARLLAELLLANGVKMVYHELPQVDHAFDLFFPKISPAAHNAIFDMERFLSLMAEDRVEPDNSNIDD